MYLKIQNLGAIQVYRRTSTTSANHPKAASSRSFASNVSSSSQDASLSSERTSFAKHLGFKSDKLPMNYFKTHPEASKDLLQWARIQLQLQDGLEGWYEVTATQVASLDPALQRLIRKHGYSLIECLKSVYSDHPWESWRFSQSSKTTFSTAEERRRFVDQIGQKLGVKNMEDWYQVQPRKFSDEGGALLLQKFRRNIFNVLSATYPEHKFQPWRFTQVSKGFWKESQNVRSFFDWAAPHCGVVELQGWYSVSSAKIQELGGATLLTQTSTLFDALKQAYPEHQWLEWLFETTPKGFWDNPGTAKRYFDWIYTSYLPTMLEKSPHIELLYEITREDLQKTGGFHLLQKYFKTQLPTALKSIYPEIEWNIKKFAIFRNESLGDLEKQRNMLKQIAQQLNLPSDDLSVWYHVNAEQIQKVEGGKSLMSKYSDSLSKALLSIYPDHSWELWQFTPTPHGFWASQIQKADFSALRALLTKKVAPPLKIETMEDWYRVSNQDLKELKVNHPISLFGGLSSALQKAFPEHKWDVELLSRKSPKKSRQLRLLHALSELFPGRKIIEEARTHQNKVAAEMDLTIPELSLALEFQGEHHYADILDVGLAERKRSTDETKAAVVQSKGYTLVSIPFWWDGKTESLGNSIRAARPDLIPGSLGNGESIPELDPKTPKVR